MVNLKPQILALLKGIPGTKQVSYHYPARWEDGNLPAISYYEAQNAEDGRTFQGELCSRVAFVVDIWAKSPSQCSVLAIKVDEAMHSMGLAREFAGDLFEPDTGIHHKSMRYGCVVNAITAEIY